MEGDVAQGKGRVVSKYWGEGEGNNGKDIIYERRIKKKMTS